MKNWTKYETVKLTKEQEEKFEDNGGSLVLDGHSIHLLGQGETECLFGYESQTGDIFVASAGKENTEFAENQPNWIEYFVDSYCHTLVYQELETLVYIDSKERN